jgi:hypothetical protein
MLFCVRSNLCVTRAHFVRKGNGRARTRAQQGPGSSYLFYVSVGYDPCSATAETEIHIGNLLFLFYS